MAERKKTSTSAFGAGRRESHDASAFYDRFESPAISDDNSLVEPVCVDQLVSGRAEQLVRDPSVVVPNSVALVVTSPPYFVGKDYELDGDHVPESYLDHLALLEDVFAGCVDALEPGGRIAVNVANLGRRPFRSQASDIIHILQDRLRLLLRGEIVWQKGKGMNGSTAWGSFQSPANPVLRDTTERVIVASKGRFDRARTRRERADNGLPHVVTISKDQFMAFTTDVWELPSEQAQRVGHPAPFPVSLPQRLIHLYTYEDDLVLDPFMGSGSAAIAALRTGRHYLGFDVDPGYIESAERRIAVEKDRLEESREVRERVQVRIPVSTDAPPGESIQARAVREGQMAKELARLALTEAGFEITNAKPRRLKSGVVIDFEATGSDGTHWLADVSGAFTSERAGLRRTDMVWSALGRAAVRADDRPMLLLTTHLPEHGSEGAKALRQAIAEGLIVDAVEILTAEGQGRLANYSAKGHDPEASVELAPAEFHYD